MIYVIDHQDAKQMPFPYIEGKTIHHQMASAIDAIEGGQECVILPTQGDRYECMILAETPLEVTVITDLPFTKANKRLVGVGQSTRTAGYQELEIKLNENHAASQRADSTLESQFNKMSDEIQQLERSLSDDDEEVEDNT